jgi:hypothetical protein
VTDETAPTPPAETDKRVTSVPLEDEDGDTSVVAQQTTGRATVAGGGEWPDPEAPPQAPAPGIADEGGGG